ncbi:hypothetical protein AX15_005446 [Amanita polypyramis BW_CC]|nr:hypothetical protein AX15_005446 [Amanita polypyramis BW_CC]
MGFLGERWMHYLPLSTAVELAVMSVKLTIPPLPTLANLNATVPDNLDAPQIASEWFNAFSDALQSATKNAVETVVSLFVEDSWWRDMLVLTWDFRTFRGVPAIRTFLQDRISSVRPRAFKLRQDFLGLQRPYEDLVWINAFFDFETDTGIGLGIFRLVPTANGEWKAHTVYTNLEDLKGFPEKIGALRHSEPNHGHWEEERNHEREFEDADPVVLVIGAGQSGLTVAARLKAYGIPTLIVERNERVGDNWRNRYNTLSLHTPVWYDHMPYLPFPSTWPKYPPAPKFGGWLEFYVEALDLNVWTSSSVTRARQDPNSKIWQVTVQRANRAERVLNVKHMMFATGIAGPKLNVPNIPGVGTFRGKTLHSSRFKRAIDYVGKKVVVVGASTSAHDVAQDCCEHGIDVTMYQRSSTHIVSTGSVYNVLFKKLYSENAPPVDISDRTIASFPLFMNLGLNQRSTQRMAELDRNILDALHKRGFRTNQGIHNTGVLTLLLTRSGGYYLDVGASRLIAEGKIKLKNDSQIKEFTETGLLFEDSSQLPADVIIFATGFESPKDIIRATCGDGVANRCSVIWGLNKEGEINGIWGGLGVTGLWYIASTQCRFYSKHVALQVKAMEEGILTGDMIYQCD